MKTGKKSACNGSACNESAYDGAACSESTKNESKCNESICEESTFSKRSCVDCGLQSCGKEGDRYPEFCLTTELSEDEMAELRELYRDPQNQKVSTVSAAVEGDFYREYTRAEEVVAFAGRMGFKKIGIATCIGLIEESRVFAAILRNNGFEVFSVVCKVGEIEKTEIGACNEEWPTGPIMCNPIAQALILNREKTDFNVVIGLCVGHDSLFYKYADALTTTLITKDRVTGHNPAAPLYQTKSYYKHLLNKKIRY